MKYLYKFLHFINIQMYMYLKGFLKYLLTETLDHEQIGNTHFGDILLNFEKKSLHMKILIGISLP